MTTTAKVIADSVTVAGDRLTTFEITYPRMVHSEFMTHRMLSRNSASSRAIPIQKMIDRVKTDPAMPARWGLNGKGMQDHGEMTPEGQAIMKAWWLECRDLAVMQAEKALTFKEQGHKQIINRVLEPYMHITVVVSGTDWANFFALRAHEDADPTIEKLATEMRHVFRASDPELLEVGKWHLPYVRDNEIIELDNDTKIKLSVARCARTSYLTHDNLNPKILEDMDLYDRLLERNPLHASPAEHQATPDPHDITPHLHGNFTGWNQFRKTLKNENVETKKYFRTLSETA